MMALTDVYNFYSKMEEDKVILSFKGTFTPELLTSIMHLMETKLNDLGVDVIRQRRVFNILVECFQNVYHHTGEQSETSSNHKRSVLVMVKLKNNVVEVRTGNYVNVEEIDKLKERLEYVNSLEWHQLRAAYRERLLTSNLSDKGTAGLGLIDIARKSKNKLDYEFIDVNDQFGFFCLNVKVG